MNGRYFVKHYTKFPKCCESKARYSTNFYNTIGHVTLMQSDT